MNELLPTVTPSSSSHKAHHDALKADYDERHPDAPLPELGGGLIDGRQSHEVIHELLAVDYNSERGVDWLPTQVEAYTLGHSEAHNALHAAYNARQR